MVVVQHLRPVKGESLLDCARGVSAEYFLRRCNSAIIRLPSGRPTVNGYEISISHTGSHAQPDAGSNIGVRESHVGGYLALMISDTCSPCGVDIELADRSVTHVAPRFACAAQISMCAACLPSNPALLAWCAKEAVYKSLHRDGVDFLHDLNILSANGQRLTVLAYNTKVELEWHVDKNNLLIVNTL